MLNKTLMLCLLVCGTSTQALRIDIQHEEQYRIKLNLCVRSTPSSAFCSGEIWSDGQDSIIKPDVNSFTIYSPGNKISNVSSIVLNESQIMNIPTTLKSGIHYRIGLYFENYTYETIHRMATSLGAISGDFMDIALTRPKLALNPLGKPSILLENFKSYDIDKCKIEASGVLRCEIVLYPKN